VRIEGRTEPAFRHLADAFEANTEHGEVGAAVAVVLNGELVVDLWGGVADEQTGRPWQRDTLVFLWSATKPVVALTAMRLADQERLDLDAPVASYWPEFAASGKGSVPVRWLLSHRAGLPVPRGPLTRADVHDWGRFVAALAASEPWWQPGSVSGYHGLTFGHLVGEVVRRAAGAASYGEVLRAEVTDPLGLDVHVGLPATEHARVAVSRWADSGDVSGVEPPADGFARARAGVFAHLPDHNDASHWSEEWPSRNGIGTARDLARLLSHAVDGSLLSADGLAAWTESQGRGVDVVLAEAGLPLEVEWGLGVMRNTGHLGPSPTAVGHGGAGGALVVADPAYGLTFAYTPNHLRDEPFCLDPRAVRLLAAVYAGL
jgi:CubicO group peptidase (beta-lactamase class C family)